MEHLTDLLLVTWLSHGDLKMYSAILRPADSVVLQAPRPGLAIGHGRDRGGVHPALNQGRPNCLGSPFSQPEGVLLGPPLVGVPF